MDSLVLISTISLVLGTWLLCLVLWARFYKGKRDKSQIVNHGLPIIGHSLPKRMSRIFRLLIALIGIGLLSGWFYWFEWRPSRIRAFCSKEAVKSVTDKTNSLDDLTEGYNMIYRLCMRSKGLSP